MKKIAFVLAVLTLCCSCSGGFVTKKVREATGTLPEFPEVVSGRPKCTTQDHFKVYHPMG